MPERAIRRTFRWYLAATVAAFSGFVLLSGALTLRYIDRDTVQRAAAEARAIFELNLAYRRWNAGHGGVYVPVTGQVRPNPYLAFHPKRDVVAADGTTLTMVNPAIMTREVHELLSRDSRLPLINKVTSLRAMNPLNLPDPWEAAALRAFESGSAESSEVVLVGGEPYLRLLRPYLTEPGCLNCHARQGYRVGDVRGGLSVGVPMAPHLAQAAGERRMALLSHLGIWLAGMAGIALLGTLIRRRERQLVESEWKFRTLAEASSDWEYWRTDDGRIVFMTPSAEQVTGWPAQDFIADPGLLDRVVHPEDRGRWGEHLREAGGTRHAATAYRIVARDGSVRWLDHTCDPITVGGTTGRRVSNREVTEQKAAEETLRRWSHIFEHAEWGVAVGSPDARLGLMNPAFARMHGYTVEELAGRPSAVLFTPESLAELPAHLAAADAAGHHAFESVHVRKDGTTFPVQCDMTTVRDDAGAVAYRVVSTQDATERRRAAGERERLEAQLHQAQKMEAIGTLAGGIAHDFNNLLTAIFAYADLGRLRAAQDPKLAGYLEEISHAGQRARDLVQQILTFSRRAEQRRVPLRLAGVVAEAMKLLRSTIPTTIEIRQRIEFDGLVLADETQLHQALMNLGTNAYHAMRGSGGTLGVTLREQAVGGGEPVPGSDLPPGRYAVLEVSDTGVGMDAKTLEKIFEPYFTTKGKGEGTGLGLAVVDGIVRSHQGRITVYSEPGHGSTFRIWLPVIAEGAAPAAVAAPAPAAAADGGTERVLLVEDEAPIRAAVSEYLDANGYRITAFADGAEALAAFERDPAAFDLVVSDMSMPGCNGKELALGVFAARPGTPVILCSGHSDLITGEEALRMGVAAYVQKPLGLSALLRVVRATLDRRRPAAQGAGSAAPPAS